MDKVSEQIKKKVNKKRTKPKPTSTLISTGCDILDLHIGGGYPLGGIVNIYGASSTAKSLLCAELISTAKNKYGDKLKWFYDDCESGFSFDTEAIYGFDIIPEEQLASKTVETMGDNLTKQLEDLNDDEMLIYVVDSLDGLSCEAEIERSKKEYAAREQGKDPNSGGYKMEKAKMLSEFFRLKKTDIKYKKCLFIIVSQVRANISGFGDKDTRSGGYALQFYCAQINKLSKVDAKTKTVKGRKITTGVTIKVTNKKNKVGKPFRECFIDIVFDYGVDNISSSLDFLYDLRTPTGKLSKKKLDWENSKGELQTLYKVNLITYIEDNDEEKLLIKRVKELWDELEDKVSSGDRKKK